MQRLETGLLLLAAIMALPGCSALPPQPAGDAGIFVDLPLARVARIEHAPLDELSGLLASRRFADTYWALNDSGAKPRLFAFDADFRLRLPKDRSDLHSHESSDHQPRWEGIHVSGAKLIDWESLARIDDRLYLADTGNNGNSRRDLGLWEVKEPDPRTTTEIAEAHYLRVHYPEQQAFPGHIREWDCEAVFADDGILYLITKHRESHGTSLAAGARLYRLDPTTIGSDSTPLQLISRHEHVFAATGADLSPDGELLAVLTYSALWLFPRPAAGDDWFSSRPFIRPLPILQTRQAEAVAWDGDHALLIANEPGAVFRIEVDRQYLGVQGSHLSD